MEQAKSTNKERNIIIHYVLKKVTEIFNSEDQSKVRNYNSQRPCRGWFEWCIAPLNFEIGHVEPLNFFTVHLRGMKLEGIH